MKICNNNEECNFSNVISIDNNGEQLIKIYPNPVLDEFKIIVSDLNKSFKIQICNQLGEVVSEEIHDINKMIDVSNLTDGIYIVKIIGTKYTFKIVKISN